MIQPLPPLLQAVTFQISRGNDVPEVSTQLADAPRRLDELAPRFKVLGLREELQLLAIKLGGAVRAWESCLRAQADVEWTDEEIKANRAAGWAERADASERAREGRVRRRDAAHRDLNQVAREEQDHIDEWIKRLDARDRGT